MGGEDVQAQMPDDIPSPGAMFRKEKDNRLLQDYLDYTKASWHLTIFVVMTKAINTNEAF